MIRIGSIVIFKTRKNSKPRIGRVADFEVLPRGFRYKIERRETGMFLDDIVGYIEGTAKPTKQTMWCFFMWMKAERIIKVLS